MEASNNKVVSINYTLKNDNGDVIDTSENREPLSYLHGSGNIIPGLENAIEGKEEGENFSITIEPKEGYGEYDESLIFDVPKTQFQNQDNITNGMQVQAQMQDGSTRILTVKEIGNEKVTLDANHPLAGETLYFDIGISDVRDATDEEKEHGHVHG